MELVLKVFSEGSIIFAKKYDLRRGKGKDPLVSFMGSQNGHIKMNNSSTVFNGYSSSMWKNNQKYSLLY